MALAKKRYMSEMSFEMKHVDTIEMEQSFLG